MLRLRLRSLFRRSRAERDLDSEIRFHLEHLIEQNLAAGMSPEEARRAALRDFGGVAQVEEQCRDARGVRFIETSLQDLRYGLRTLGRSPGFAATAVLSLALGIGANTAIFSLIDALMLRMLPVRDPGRLVLFAKYYQNTRPGNFSYPSFEWFRDHNQVFSGVLAVTGMPRPNVSYQGESTPANVELVSGNFHTVLGVHPILGRALSEEDNRVPGGHPVAVLSYDYWKRRFALDPAAAGKAVNINGTLFTIVGVTPPGFSGVESGRPADLFIPVMMDAQVRGLPKTWVRQRQYNWLYLVARLKPGVTLAQAQAEVDVLFRQYLSETVNRASEPGEQRDYLAQKIELSPGAGGLDWMRREFAGPLAILMAVVALVLLIACANIANLLLARGAARQREIAIRLALGAGRWRLVRQLLTESLLLAAMGGALGLAAAGWMTRGLVKLMSLGWIRIALSFQPDVRVLAFTASVAVLTAVLFGLAPARAATRLNLRGARFPLGKALVVSQVALSVILLVGAGLFVRTLRNLETLDPGFVRENILIFSIEPAEAGYQGARAANLYRALLERVRAIPGVRAASISMLTPITGGGVSFSLDVEGRMRQPDEDTTVYYNKVGPGYFETLGTPLLMGRDFSPRDNERSPRVVIVNESVARRYFPGANPIGGRIRVGRSPAMEIIGIVKDARYLDLRSPAPPTVYAPCFQDADSGWGMTVEMRTAASPRLLAPLVRREVEAIDPKLRVPEFSTLAAQVSKSLLQERLVASVSGGFGGLALLLAAMGLYGVMAYAAARRTREIGIRVALGARPGDVIRMVLRETLLLVAMGIGLGLPAALAVTRLIASRLYGLRPADPLTLLFSAVLMMATALLAGFLPARRASRGDPLAALRHE